MANGRVTLVAKDVTVREILAEWARVGQTRIVNAEKLTGGPVTLELDGRAGGAGARHGPAFRGRLRHGAAHGRRGRALDATTGS